MTVHLKYKCGYFVTFPAKSGIVFAKYQESVVACIHLGQLTLCSAGFLS